MMIVKVARGEGEAACNMLLFVVSRKEEFVSHLRDMMGEHMGNSWPWAVVESDEAATGLMIMMSGFLTILRELVRYWG